ncbi:MAG: hypothetical protein M3Z10_01240 [Gemmatimonadota bacterium]|nr:hypothetical protein [Gemmatimonadota bacterium]
MPVGVLSLLLLGAAAGACSPQPQASEGKPTRSPASVLVPPPLDTSFPASSRDTGPDDRPRLVRLEQEARALAKTEGCTSASACRTAPVGWRGCGGPRTYLVYCAMATDTIALFGKLKELEEAEKAYNARSGMMSTCEFRMPPGTKLVGRSCREGPSTPPSFDRPQ